MKRILIHLLLACTLCLVGCKEADTESQIVIGFSQCVSQDIWRSTMYSDMQNALIQYPNAKIIMADAGGDSQKQIKDIEQLFASGIDVLIVSPNEAKPLNDVISKVRNGGVPVVAIDRKVGDDNFDAFVGADNFQIGQAAGEYISSILAYEGNILEIWGLEGSSPAIERHNGFVDVINQYPDIKITARVDAQWFQNLSYIGVNKLVQTGEINNFDLIFAQSDFMAFGAADAIAPLGDERPLLTGVDALANDGAGMDAVMSGRLSASFIYPTGGDKAIDIAMQLATGQSVPKQTLLATTLVNKKTAPILKAQLSKISELDSKIQIAQRSLNDSILRNKSMRFLLVLLSVLLVVFVALLYYVFVAYRKLSKQKQQITVQNEALTEMSGQLKEATEAKIRFFTNVSHELRTPLTLILGPIEDLLDNQDLRKEERQSALHIIHQNAARLLNIVNQLIDLRKINAQKLELKIASYPLNNFLQVAYRSFKYKADKLNILYEFNTQVGDALCLYFDKEKMNQVIFNLLSNAFKHTPKGGNVSINVCELPSKEIKIEIKDSGEGISKDMQQHIFKRFYSVSSNTNDPTSGIGLALTKELVDFHQGDIELVSEPNKGASFSVLLKQGKVHLEELPNIIFEENTSQLLPVVVNDEDSEYISQLGKDTSNIETNIDKPSILIVEDNKDLINYIQVCLQEKYHTQAVSNGQLALDYIENTEPDAIITDIMMPIMDGLSLTSKLKGDINTCHIPIIVLSALGTMSHRVEGIKHGADSYIAKPFNKEHLLTRIEKLVEGRRQMRKHYINRVSTTKLEGEIGNLDKEFLKQFTSLVEDNMNNNELSVELISQKLNISRTHLYRKIKKLTGMSATELIRRIRLKKAALLILESDMSTSQVAYECGFASPSYFSKCFKEVYKVSPSDYC